MNCPTNAVISAITAEAQTQYKTHGDGNIGHDIRTYTSNFQSRCPVYII